MYFVYFNISDETALSLLLKLYRIRTPVKLRAYIVHESGGVHLIHCLSMQIL